MLSCRRGVVTELDGNISTSLPQVKYSSQRPSLWDKSRDPACCLLLYLLYQQSPKVLSQTQLEASLCDPSLQLLLPLLLLLLLAMDRGPALPVSQD